MSKSMCTMKPLKRMPIPRYVVLSSLFLTLLLGSRFVWSEGFTMPPSPQPVNGTLDLRGWDLSSASPVSLDGEWMFYPNALFSLQKLLSSPNPPRSIIVPGDWQSEMSTSSSSFGYGTYRLRILIDSSVKDVALWAQKIQASSIVEINGNTIAGFGRPAVREQDYKPERTAFTATYATNGATELELLVQAANFDDPYSGGLTRSLYFGTPEAIARDHGLSVDLQKITFAILLLHSLYALAMFFFNRKQRALLTFSLLTFSAALTVVSDHDGLLLSWLPLNFTWMVKAKALSYPLFSFFMLLLARSFSNSSKAISIFRMYAGLLGAHCAFLLVAPVRSIYVWLETGISDVLYLFPIAWSVVLFMKMAADKRDDATFLLFAATSSLSSVLWGMVNSHNEITNVYYPIDVIAAIFGFSAYWFKKYFRNASKIQHLYDQLKEEDAQKDQFLANTAHELRTPLHGMINIAESIAGEERRRTGKAHSEDMKLLITIGRRMSQLVDDLLDVIRLKEKRIGLQYKDVSLASVVSGVVSMFRYMAEGKPVNIVMEIPDTLPLIQADERRLVQILYNLLHNALKFTDEGTITVAVEATMGVHATMRVSDTGIGMSEEMQNRIFDAYEQGTSNARLSGGLGLGLSICKQLVELHGGSIAVHSVLGQGSTFIVHLPLGQPAAQIIPPGQRQTPIRHEPTETSNRLDDENTFSRPHPFNAESHERAAARILVVDDDPVNLRVLVSMLSSESYLIQPAASARQALEWLEGKHWDLVIADVMMPQMSGYELTEKLRGRFSASELPILLLTARNEPADIYAGFLAGATDYVTKPVDAMELKHRIRSLVDLKQSVDERFRMEAAYLQAQIQPHFLFNTLNSIMALSDLDTERMQKLGDAFISYLQTSFDFLNAENLVHIQHELELVRAYLYIEKERFPDRLNIVWDIPDTIDVLLPPLTIQPLVENAVRHGVLSQAEGGTLRIQMEEQKDGILIEIQDDGAGMDESRIAQALTWPKSRTGQPGGIGLTNTNRRLNQIYGQGLHIVSKPGKGTKVSFIITNG